MLRLLFLVFLLVPLLDLMVLVAIGTRIGLTATVALVVLTALVGVLLARFAGRRNLRRIESSLRSGELPTDHVIDGVLIFSAGLLLLTPGVVTDVVALAMLFTPTRMPIRLGLKRWFIVPYLERRSGGFVSGDVYVGGFPGAEQGGTTRDGPVDVDIEVEDVDGDDSAGDSKP